MHLRLATIDDFAFITKLREDYITDMIYRESSYTRQVAMLEESQVSKDDGIFDAETLKILEEEFNLTLEKFSSMLEKEYYRFFVCEYEGIPIGYIQISKIQGKRWKLHYVNICEDYQDEWIFVRMLKLLCTEKGLSKVDVCTWQKERQTQIQKAGFEAIGGSFFRFSNSKH